MGHQQQELRSPSVASSVWWRKLSPSNVPRAQIAPEQLERYHFFGEDCRACFRRLHILDAARLLLFADIAKLVLELTYFVAHIGYVDAVCCLQLSWAVLGTGLALPALCAGEGERFYRYLWPLLALKMAECACCLLVLLLIFVLGVSGPIGYTLLRLLIQWKYRRVEDDDMVPFALATFLVVCLLLVFNCYVLHTFWRLRGYLHAKALYLYLRQRNQAIRAIRPSFFHI